MIILPHKNNNIAQQDGLTANEAQDRLRDSFLDAVTTYIAEFSPNANPNDGMTAASDEKVSSSSSSFKWSWVTKAISSKKKRSTSRKSSAVSNSISTILDIGCSVGVSTKYIAAVR